MKGLLFKFMPIEIRNEEDLELYTKKFFNENDYNKKIICIDGECGTRKTTTLAPVIAKKINANIISTDKYLKNAKQEYFKYIDFNLLKSDILKSLEKGNVVIEGILLLKILEKIQLIPEKLIHAISDGSFDEYQFNKNKNCTEIIKEAGKGLALISKNKKNIGLSKFQKEVFKYYKEYRPVEKADDILILYQSFLYEE